MSGRGCSDTADAPRAPAATTPILSLITAARGHNRAPGEPRKKRIVVRFSRADLGRIDAVRAHFPRTSRAQMLRAFCVAGLAMVDPQSEPTPTAPAGEGAP